MAKRKTGSGSGLDMRALARAGARARLDALRAEQEALLTAFPDLRGGSSRASAAGAPTGQRAGRGRGAGATRKRRGMSAEQRRAVGERMRAYWAARRAEKAAGGQSSGEQGGTKGRGRKRARGK